MPALKAPATVLVTGANGFNASWIVRNLLESGYRVRGTVRGEDKATHLKKQFKNYSDEGKLEFVVVADIVKPGAFDSAVKGVDAIVHTATPFHFAGGHVNEFSEPAVKGTVGVLESALKHAGPQLKRVIVLSSIASVCPVIPTHVETFNEESWNEADIKQVQELGENATPFAKYSSAKTLAEKAAWAFVDQHKNEITWDLVTLCPTMVFGPIIHDVPDPSALNTSVKEFYDATIAHAKPAQFLAMFQSAWVDVRDVALAHVRALELDAAAGRRFIVSAENFVWQDVFDAVNSLAISGAPAPTGTPGAGKEAVYYFKYDTTNARTVLCVETRDLTTTAKDTIESFREHGWLKK